MRSHLHSGVDVALAWAIWAITPCLSLSLFLSLPRDGICGQALLKFSFSSSEQAVKFNFGIKYEEEDASSPLFSLPSFASLAFFSLSLSECTRRTEGKSGQKRQSFPIPNLLLRLHSSQLRQQRPSEYKSEGFPRDKTRPLISRVPAGRFRCCLDMASYAGAVMSPVGSGMRIKRTRCQQAA